MRKKRKKQNGKLVFDGWIGLKDLKPAFEPVSDEVCRGNQNVQRLQVFKSEQKVYERYREYRKVRIIEL